MKIVVRGRIRIRRNKNWACPVEILVLVPGGCLWLNGGSCGRVYEQPIPTDYRVTEWDGEEWVR